MFFRRAKAHEDTFTEYLTKVRQAGFDVETTARGAKVSRDGVAAVLENVEGSHPRIVERGGTGNGA